MRSVRSCSFLALAAFALQLSQLTGGADNLHDADVKLLEGAGVTTDTRGLLEFLRLRTYRESDRKALEDLVGKLGGSFREREQAMRALVMRGPVAIPFLKAGMKGAALEVFYRAKQCINKIESMGPEYPAAAVHLLARAQSPDAIPVLLEYSGKVDDNWLRDEVLDGIGRLTIRGDRIDPLLLAELKAAAPPRRAAAAYILARHGGLEQRDRIRRLLDDPEPSVRALAGDGLLGKRLGQNLRENTSADEALVRTYHGSFAEASLLEFLRKRTLSDEDQRRIRRLVRQLGAATYYARADASKKLIAQGPPALPFLRDAVRDPDLEIARRAFICLEEIKRGPGSALPAAVIRLLARPQPPEHSTTAVIQTLIAYVPFADNSEIEEEVLNGLCLLSVRQGKVEPLLPAALRDPLPERRAAAAYVLGKIGSREHCQSVHNLLSDPGPVVRFRAAQGLIAAGDKAAIPVLISLLANKNSAFVWPVEEILRSIAGDAEVPGTMDAASVSRDKMIGAWQTWWQSHAVRIDLRRAGQEPYLGLFTISEYDSPAGLGQVYECGRDGRERWKIKGLFGAMDAQVLPNGRILVAENSARRVSERDPSGAIKWQYLLQSNPITCQRLPNGNTFIATYNQLLEVTPARQVVYTHNRGPGFYLFSARKQRNGQIACMTAQGKLLLIDSRSGQETRAIQVGPQGSWCSAEALANGRYLVATMTDGRVRELDAAGKTHWQVHLPGAFRATRLPNGHTLVASMTTRRVVEFDRGGKIRWERTCEGRPWSLRYR